MKLLNRRIIKYVWLIITGKDSNSSIHNQAADEDDAADDWE